MSEDHELRLDAMTARRSRDKSTEDTSRYLVPVVPLAGVAGEATCRGEDRVPLERDDAHLCRWVAEEARDEEQLVDVHGLRGRACAPGGREAGLDLEVCAATGGQRPLRGHAAAGEKERAHMSGF